MSVRVPGVGAARLVVLRLPAKTASRRRFWRRRLTPQAVSHASLLVAFAVMWSVTFALLVLLLERHRVLFGIPMPIPTVESLGGVAWFIAGFPMGQQLKEEWETNPMPGARLMYALWGSLGPFIFSYRLLREVWRGRRA